MDFISDELNEYCVKHSDAETELLKELGRQTHLKTTQPRMLSGHLQGSFLAMLSALARPTNILEIGTFTGYSALCLAHGLKVGGKLITVDTNAETARMARDFFDRSIYKDNIEFILGNAAQVIPTLNYTFDLVFIDADKKNYGLYYDLVFDKVNTGGLIIADNVLWSGKVLEPTKNKDTDTQAIIEFNKKIVADTRIEKVMLPLRDGVTLMRKK